MHYYQHHIGDFDRATRHLTRIERSIYLDMLFLYYDSEQALPLDVGALGRKIVARSEEEKAAVLAVLNEFFHETPTGWFHDRCEEEIAEYRKSKKQASEAGKASAAARAERRRLAMAGNATGSERRGNGNPTTVERPLNERATDAQPTFNEVPTNHKPVTSKQKNPPIPPKGGEGEEKKKSAIALQTFLADCKRDGLKPIPDGDPVFDYAERVGIPDDFLRLQWLEFKERYTQDGAKRYKAWPTVFGKAVRGNWFKLWFVGNDGNYALTTVGQQAQRNHAGPT